MSSYILTVQEDKESGDLYFIIPPDILESLNWNENDTIKWKELPNGRFQLSKIE